MPNTKTVMVVSQKGGVGKSTIAEEIAYSLDRTSTPYNYYDLDGQGGSVHGTVERDDAVVQIVDTPAGLDDATLASLPEADFVVVACKPTPRDVAPLERTLSIVEDAGLPYLVVVTHSDPRHRLTREFMEDYIVDRVGAGNVVTLPLSQMYPQADMAERSVVEYARRHTAAASTLAMVDTVRARVGLPPERPEKELHARQAPASTSLVYKQLADNSRR